MSKNITPEPKKKLKKLNYEEERRLLALAKKGLKLHNEKKKVPLQLSEAISILIYYNQNLIKYIVRGYSFSFFSGQIDYEDLVAEGTTSLLKAIEKFDLNSKFRFDTYAGYWIRQYIQSFINKNQLISQSPTTKEKKNIVFYDSSYQNHDEQSKSYSLLDTLHDTEGDKENYSEEIRQRNITEQVNSLINSLEKREEILLIRLWHKIPPLNLLDIYHIAEKEEQEELKKSFKLVRNKNLNSLKDYSLQEKKNCNLPVVKKYLEMFGKNYKFSELTKLLNKSENSARKLKQESFKKLQELTKERKLHFLFE